MSKLTYTTSKNFNKLLVVGHPDSNIEFVVDIMKLCNIHSANFLKKENIEPKEISNILLKAHGIFDLTQENIEINPVWNGLAMDLMMSNLEYDRWVWSDSRALPLLNYWKSLDASLSFVLVYHSPEEVLNKYLQEPDFDRSSALEEWKAYNRTMLNFFYRNQECCLLVNAERVEESSKNYLLEVSKKIGVNRPEIPSYLEQEELLLEKKPKKNSIGSFLLSKIVERETSVRDLYLELESIASLPLASFSQNYSFDELLDAYIAEQQEYRLTSSKLVQTQKEKEALSKALESENKKLKASQTENELQLTQLMSVQEELEKYYLEKKSLEEKLSQSTQTLNQKSTQFNTTQTILTQTQKEKEALSKALESENKKLKASQTENELQLTQLMSVQEELEKYYLENKKLREPKVPKLYGAGNRIKQQLSYRLGDRMIQKSKTLSGKIGLPFALYAERQKFKKEQKNKKKLPPIHTYADAYEAENMKKHLSYRLGQAMIESMKSPFGIFKLPSALKNAHDEYKKDRR